MGKVKIHEIAIKIGVNSKEVLEKALELGLDVKSHMSSVDEVDAKKIESKFSGVKKEIKDKKEGPVIIRREVIVSDYESEKIKEEKKIEKKQNRDVGFIERERKTDYNIVYRNKPNKPLTVSELFGRKTTPEKPKNEIKVEPKPQETVKKSDEKENTVNEKQQDRRNNITTQTRPYNNGNRPFNREGYNNRSYNNYNNTNRQFNRDFQNNGNRSFNRNGQNNRSFNRNGQGQSNFGRRPLDEKGIEKNIKNIMTDVVEKEVVREYNKSIDKQKRVCYHKAQ